MGVGKLSRSFGLCLNFPGHRWRCDSRRLVSAYSKGRFFRAFKPLLGPLDVDLTLGVLIHFKRPFSVLLVSERLDNGEWFRS